MNRSPMIEKCLAITFTGDSGMQRSNVIENLKKIFTNPKELLRSLIFFELL